MEAKTNSVTSPALVMRKAALALATIFVVTFVLILISLYLQGNFASILANPISWFNSLDPSLTFDIILTAAELLAAVLAIAITVVAIVVELAANRYSHRITSLFIREPINIMVMCFFVIATIYSVWIALTLDATVESATVLNAGLLTSMLMVTTSLVVLLPYFAFVMSFLSPENIVLRIQKTGLDCVRNIDSTSTRKSKLKLLNAVDELQDIARRSVELSDRAVEMASINALRNIVLSYQGLVAHAAQVTDDWFQTDNTISTDPDFISLTHLGLARINEERLWVEVKVMRQYLDLISDSNPSSRDTSYLIAINTRRIATESLGFRPGLELVELCLRCFNSYLRATINNNDPRTGYFIMNQYRMLAEELLIQGQRETVNQIALYLQFYGLLGYKQGLPFLLEVAAEDIANLAGGSIEKDSLLLDGLLELLLELDQEIKDDHSKESLLGVRRAQLKLATRCLEAGDEQRATKICIDLKSEKLERMQQVIRDLKKENRKEYWEFTDRGVNFSYLDPSLRTHLSTLANMIFD